MDETNNKKKSFKDNVEYIYLRKKKNTKGLSQEKINFFFE